MKFTREFLLEVLSEDQGEIISDEIVDQRRWSTTHWLVFKFEDRYWGISYSCGSTEQQPEGPWEYEGDEIECDELEPFEKTIIAYRNINTKKEI